MGHNNFCRPALLFATFLAATQFARAQDEFKPNNENLTRRYRAEIARKVPPLKRDPYDLAFASETAGSPAEYVGNLINAWSLQQKIIAIYQKHNRGLRENMAAPENSKSVKLGFAWLQRNLEKRCRDCDTAEKQLAWNRAVNDYFVNVFDIKNSQHRFSGLPFYGFAEKTLRDSVFQQRAIALHQKLHSVVVGLASPLPCAASTNLWQIALEICDANAAGATQLLGLLLSRDVAAIHYFKYISVHNDRLIRAVGEIPLLVRLAVELDRDATRTGLDRFSYDGHFSSRNTKNYYFWSAAFASQQMVALGYDEATVRQLAMELSRQYKSFRFAGSLGWPFSPAQESIIARANFSLMLEAFRYLVKPPEPGAPANSTEPRSSEPNFFLRDALEVMRKSGEGAQFAYRNCRASIAQALAAPQN